MRTPRQIALEVVPADSMMPKTFTLAATSAARAAIREVLRELTGKLGTEFSRVEEVKAWVEQKISELGPTR